MGLHFIDLKFPVITCIVIALFLLNLLLVFIFTQRKNLQHERVFRMLHEIQQNRLIETAIQMEEKERHRIAEELHDEVGAILSSTKLHFHGLELSHTDEYNHSLYVKGKELLDEAIGKIRGISHNLHPCILQTFGLNEAIDDFVSKIGSQSALRITTLLDDSFQLKTDEDLNVYRIVQELINNTIKHAGANEIQISSAYTEDQLNLRIWHNGEGLTQANFDELTAHQNSIGIKSMLSRITILQGYFKFSKQSLGYIIDIFIPITR